MADSVPLPFGDMLEYILETMGWNLTFFINAYSPFEKRGQYFVSKFLCSVRDVAEYFAAGEDVKVRLRGHLRKQISLLNTSWSQLTRIAKLDGREVSIDGELKE